MSGVECSQSSLKTVPLTRSLLQLFAWQESHSTEVRTASVTQVRLGYLQNWSAAMEEQTRFSLQFFAWQESHITEVRTASVTQVRLDGLWEMVGQGYAHCLLLQARVLKHFNLHASICLLVCLVACLTGYWYNRVHCCRAAG